MHMPTKSKFKGHKPVPASSLLYSLDMSVCNYSCVVLHFSQLAIIACTKMHGTVATLLSAGVGQRINNYAPVIIDSDHPETIVNSENQPRRMVLSIELTLGVLVPARQKCSAVNIFYAVRVCNNHHACMHNIHFPTIGWCITSLHC